LRYFIFISYKGTSYHGWQLQPNSVTIQKLLEEALSTILSQKITTIGAGRTDTGVHAIIFCAHFDYNGNLTDNFDRIIHRLNSFLPKDISVSSIKPVRPDTNARFSALSRTYKYFISRGKDPFSEESSWYVHGEIKVQKMITASELLLNVTDFTSFSKLHSDNKTNICKIYEAGWLEKENQLIFTIRADRFLRNMVRAIVGTMVELGTGKIEISDFERIIAEKNRSSAGKSAPAKGLFLWDIEYPEDIYV
jgi:tRNA pseudouridine38-40 synthase